MKITVVTAENGKQIAIGDWKRQTSKWWLRHAWEGGSSVLAVNIHAEMETRNGDLTIVYSWGLPGDEGFRAMGTEDTLEAAKAAAMRRFLGPNAELTP